MSESGTYIVEGCPVRLQDVLKVREIICFFCRYLENEVFKKYADRLCFITPDVTQFIKLYEGELCKF